MATASVPNTFVNGGGNADATEVNANFSQIVGFLNTETVQRDGAVAFTAVQSHPNAPTTGNHVVNKTYADGFIAGVATLRVALTRATATASIPVNEGVTAIWTAETADAGGFWSSGTTLTVPTGGSGFYSWFGTGTATAAANGQHAMNLYQNSKNRGGNFYGGATTSLKADGDAYLTAGDTLTFEVYNGLDSGAVTFSNLAVTLVRLGS